MTSTTWIQRFTEALTLLCGAAPDTRLVSDWLDHTNDDLQSWAASNTVLSWAQGILVIDAATLMADSPEEGTDNDGNPLHKDRQ